MGVIVIRSAIIVVLLVIVAVLADRVAREENQRYALEQGYCQAAGQPDAECLATVQTRSAWAWQLYDGVVGQMPQVPWTSEPTPKP
jgi:hypothetical protein